MTLKAISLPPFRQSRSFFPSPSITNPFLANEGGQEERRENSSLEFYWEKFKFLVDTFQGRFSASVQKSTRAFLRTRLSWRNEYYSLFYLSGGGSNKSKDSAWRRVRGPSLQRCVAHYTYTRTSRLLDCRGGGVRGRL